MIDVQSLFGRRADNRWDRISMGDIFERWAIHSPDAEALVAWHGASSHPDYARVTYGFADVVATQVAHALINRGLQRGDRVFLVCGNSVESFLVKIGVAKAGGVVTAVNPDQTSAVIEHAMAVVEPTFVVVDAAYLDRLSSLPARPQQDIVIPIGGEVPAGAVGFRELHRHESAEPLDVRIHGDDIWEILFTSGTTAMPKAVMLSHTYGHLCALSWAMSYSRGLVHEGALRIACFTPTTFHIGDQGYMMPALFVGGAIVVGRRYDPHEIARALQEESPTALIGGGSHLLQAVAGELERTGASAKSLSCIVYGPGPITRETRDRLKTLAPDAVLLTVAAQTEAAAGHRFIGDAFPDKYEEALTRVDNIVGRPSPLLSARIGDDDTRPGDVGELIYRSPIMMAGYYRDPDATEAAFEGGWFHTGDLASEDSDGFRVLAGRLKEMIKTGGENVSCVRVESVLQQHPAVDRVVVVGLPDERWGEAVTAVVVLDREQPLIATADIIAFARERLARFEVPKYVVFADSLPADFQGKVSRLAVRESIAAKAATSDPPASPAP